MEEEKQVPAKADAEAEARELPWWKLQPKVPKTEEDFKAIEILNRLRAGVGDKMPEGLPLACIVRVVDYEDIHKAGENYAMIAVYGPDDKLWRMCIRRGQAAIGDEVLFVGANAALPLEERFDDPLVCSLKQKVYKFGNGIRVRRMRPIIKRNIYLHNCGVIYPLDDFREDLRRCRIGEDCSMLLNIDNHEELKERQNVRMPRMVIEETPPAPATLKARKQAAEMHKREKMRDKNAKRHGRESAFKFLDTVRWFRVDPSATAGLPPAYQDMPDQPSLSDLGIDPPPQQPFPDEPPFPDDDFKEYLSQPPPAR